MVHASQHARVFLVICNGYYLYIIIAFCHLDTTVTGHCVHMAIEYNVTITCYCTYSYIVRVTVHVHICAAILVSLQ